jgi:hypothetical protein
VAADLGLGAQILAADATHQRRNDELPLGVALDPRAQEFVADTVMDSDPQE